MAIAKNSLQSVWLPRLRYVLRVEQEVVFVGVLITALFAALKVQVPLLFLAVCILVVGNLLYFFQVLPSRFFDELSFPWNWVLLLPILAVGCFVGALCSVTLLRWMVPTSTPYWTFFRDNWQVPVVVAMGASIVGYTVREVQRNLRKKNKLLEQAVEHGNVALQQQEQELHRALDIQRDLLPKELPQLPGLDLAGAWQPARTIGGDYFDVLRLDENRLGICVGDVAGKGLTASLLMANLQAAFRAYAMPDASPSSVCAKLNAFVCGNVAPGKFITLFYAIFDARTHTLTYENAGHCPALLLRSSGQTELLEGQGGVLGVLPEWAYKDATVQLTTGDRLLFYTDGVTEAEDDTGEEFGYERIAAVAGRAAGSAAECKRRVMEEVAKFCAGEFSDDVTLIVAMVR